MIKLDCRGLNATRADRLLAHQAALAIAGTLDNHRGRWINCPLGVRWFPAHARGETTLNESSIDESFKDTFELNCPNYFTLILPPRTDMCGWYSEHQTLTRGSFQTERKAHQWAEENLCGGPYTVRFVDTAEDID